MNESTTDDIYAYALSKTLTKVSSPATVGLYSSCQNRINMILEQMEVCMERERSRIEESYEERPKPRSAKPSFTDFLALFSRLLFYWPVWTEKNQQHHNIRFIHVKFSAWHFAGSDLLWAGMAIRLFQAMQMNFGKLQLVLYRVVQHDEEEEIKKKIVKGGPNDWRSKKICCCPLWFFVLILLVLPPIFLFLFTSGLFQFEVESGEEVKESHGPVGVLKGLAIASLGVPAVSTLRFIFVMCKNLIFSQELNLKKGMDNDRISNQLGFMNEVRKEMWFLSRFIQFMEVFERRRIRVVLNITNLDRCSPKKIIAVLDAINILLSDEESQLISILAVNPEVIVEKVNFADGCFSKEDRAYALLNRIVTLAFTVPPLCDNSRRKLFYSLTSNSKTTEDSSSDIALVEVTSETMELNPLISKNTKVVDVKEEEVESLVSSILTSNEGNLNKYMLDDAMSMRRVINSIRVTVIIMKALRHDEFPQQENVAAWVVLANHWPCRLSWIIQCVEDAQQRADIDHNNLPNTDHSKTLWKVYSESRAELYVMSSQIEDLLEEDGDPEMFERFLSVDFQFTVNDLNSFKTATVNLDSSIRKELAQIRGTSRLRDSGWMRNLAPLPITTVINMKTDDICKELERMEYPRKYIDIVRTNDLNGSALVFGDAEELKDLLGMTFGEWATFRLHFLDLQPHLRPQYKNMPPTLSQLKKHKIHTHSPSPLI